MNVFIYCLVLICAFPLVGCTDSKQKGIFKTDELSVPFDKTDASFTLEVADASDYYFVCGKDMDEVVSGYRQLTGSVPMFGKWAYRFWQSKERYKSFDELESVVKKYRNVPLDDIVQDWEYWGDKSNWNKLAFDSVHFDYPKQVIEKLHNKDHAHLMLSVWSGFGEETARYESLDSIDALSDEPTWAGYKIFDAYNPMARNLFWDYLKKGPYDKGSDFWTGKVFEGGSVHVQPCVLDILPLYVKAGSIIPVIRVKEYADEFPNDQLELRIYGGKDASFLWYDGEGDSYRYEDGFYSKVSMLWDDKRQILEIKTRDGHYFNMPEFINLTIKLYLPTSTVCQTKVCVYTGKKNED